jgi:hypothetical protein
VLGFSVVAAVWQQLPGAGPRKQLWQLMHADLLPLLEQCAEQLAYGSSGAQPTPAAAAGAAFAHMLLLCHVVELLVLGRPAHVDVGQQLTQAGVTRSLVTLFGTWGSDAAAEPLRRAVLLCCCSSPPTAAWVLAVPHVSQQLRQHPAFQLGGPCEAHGALWQLLQSQGATTGGGSGAGSTGSCGEQQQQQQLLALLALDPASSGARQLQRQVVALQLMAGAQAAAGSRRWLFTDQASVQRGCAWHHGAVCCKRVRRQPVCDGQPTCCATCSNRWLRRCASWRLPSRRWSAAAAAAAALVWRAAQPSTHSSRRVMLWVMGTGARTRRAPLARQAMRASMAARQRVWRPLAARHGCVCRRTLLATL